MVIEKIYIDPSVTDDKLYILLNGHVKDFFPVHIRPDADSDRYVRSPL
jgi:hypothetical protein